MSNRVLARAAGTAAPSPEPQPIVEEPASTADVTNVAADVAVQDLLVANPDRLQAMFYNDSATATLYLKFGPAASATSFTVKMVPQAYYEMPYRYTGLITGVWTAAVGAARITELTP